MKNIKYLSLLLLALSFMSSNLIAAEDGLERFRLGIFGGFSNIEQEVDGRTSTTREETYYNIRAYYFDYQELNPTGIGYSVGFTFSNFANDNETISQFMIEGNANYSLNRSLHFFGGLNLSQYTSEEESRDALVDNLGIGFGAQVGVGYQVFKHLGVELRYMHTIHLNDGSRAGDITYTASGARLGLIGSF